MNYTIKYNQGFFDIALMFYSDPSLAIDIAYFNDMTLVTRLRPGTVIKLLDNTTTVTVAEEYSTDFNEILTARSFNETFNCSFA